MRVSYLFVTILSFFIITTCTGKSVVNEELQVISTIYKAIPKVISAPPRPSKNSEIEDSIVEQMDYNELNSKTLKYAINKNYVNFELSDSPAFFQVYNAKKLFDKVKLNEEELVLIDNLGRLNYTQRINESVFLNDRDESVLFIDKQIINKEDKKNYNIDGVISFSKVSFSKSENEAVVCAGVYHSGLDSSLIIYILEKVNQVWRIKSYKTMSVS